MDGKFLNEMLASRDGQQVMASDCSSELIEYDVLHRSHLLFLQWNHHRHSLLCVQLHFLLGGKLSYTVTEHQTL